MGLTEYILIGVGAVALLFVIGNLIMRVSLYYQQRFNMSIWAGVFMLVISAVIGTYSFVHYDKPNAVLLVLSFCIAALILYLDIRHAGVGMGILAFLFQLIMSFLFVFVLIMALIRMVVNLASHRRGRQVLAVAGGAEAVRMFYRFFIP